VVAVDLVTLEPPVRRLLGTHRSLRTLDAIQVAVALRLAEAGVEDLVVVTRDDRQAAAARAEGLTVDDGAKIRRP